MSKSQKTIAILGATGMLGSGVYGALRDDYQLTLVVRDVSGIGLLEKAWGGTSKHRVFVFDANDVYDDFYRKFDRASPALMELFSALESAEYVINCIGITIPHSLRDPSRTFFMNTALPHLLAQGFGERLIHITTDCAFNGSEGYPYSERSPKTPVDIYGLSKALGEPTECLTLRTSIIGRELSGFHGLLEWFLQQNEKTITGFANHFWNGITTKQFGKICDTIIKNPERFPRAGLFHVFSTTLSKYEMVLKFREKYNIDCEITPDHEKKLNRTLTTIHELNALLQIPSFDAMLEDLP